MKRSTVTRLALSAALSVVATGLASCGSGGSSDTLTIETDYAHDEFAGSMLAFFPSSFTVNPGMTVRFHQTWTGEPHTVTLGTRVDELAKPFRQMLKTIFKTGKFPEGSEGPPEGYREFEEGLPSFFAEEGVNQAAGQPCYALTAAEIPKDESPCRVKTLKPFRGTEAYYSSGFIPFEGERGNTFEMDIAADAKPGTYLYYCNLHGAPMGGEITITENGEASKQSDLNRQAKREADRMAKPLLEVYRDEKAGKSKIKGNLAGSGDDRIGDINGIVNEFTPRTITAAVGEKVTWTFIENHTISFNVPKYAPLFVVEKNGHVSFNKDLDKAAGGWPGRTPPLPDRHWEGEPPATVTIDAGEFDGTGTLKSSGTGWITGDKYSVTFTKKGTYPYACLIHPGMIGKVVVK